MSNRVMKMNNKWIGILGLRNWENIIHLDFKRWRRGRLLWWSINVQPQTIHNNSSLAGDGKAMTKIFSQLHIARCAALTGRLDWIIDEAGWIMTQFWQRVTSPSVPLLCHLCVLSSEKAHCRLRLAIINLMAWNVSLKIFACLWSIFGMKETNYCSFKGVFLFV